VSDDGVVVVGYCTVTPTGTRAFRWTRDDGMSSLGELGTESRAEAVSSDGAVIVGTYGDGRLHMFRWTQATGMVSEPALADEIESLVYDVNGDGSVAVGRSSPSGTAFRWTEAEGLDLGRLHAIDNSVAWGVSGDGAIVVGDHPSEGLAFRWTAATGSERLPDSPQPGRAFARAISRDGRLIAGYGISTGESWGLLWRGDGIDVFEGLGSDVRAVSNTGIVIATYAVWNGALRTPHQALEDIGIVIDTAFEPDVSSIRSISADGNYYVGTGEEGAFIARSPALGPN
jgi:probable HAF family extracellular repeat protein